MKQETLEEVAINCWAKGTWDNRDDFTDGFVEGAKWQKERSYSKEDMKIAFDANIKDWISFKEFIEQFKNK